jgi:hypothetical protein
MAAIQGAGAINVGRGSTLDVTASTFTSNTGTISTLNGRGGQGGAIFAYVQSGNQEGSTLRISSCTFIANTAPGQSASPEDNAVQWGNTAHTNAEANTAFGPCASDAVCGDHGSCDQGFCRCSDQYTGGRCEALVRMPRRNARRCPYASFNRSLSRRHSRTPTS